MARKTRKRRRVEKMKRDILALCHSSGTPVTFAKLGTFVEGFEGTEPYWAKGCKRVIIWDSMSERAIQAIDELYAERHIFYVPSSMFDYMDDGRTLWGKQIRRVQYPQAKKRRWWTLAIVTEKRRDNVEVQM